LLVLKVIFFL